MIVLGHRGYWNNPLEKNTEAAFRRAFSQGFGIETDVRDLAGTLVISHDPPQGAEMTFERLLQIHSEYDAKLWLAINIKADGLQKPLQKILCAYRISNYFVFDMSVPDLLGYIQAGLCTFTRESEYEKELAGYNQVQGVWLDEFHGHWIAEDIVFRHVTEQKKVCIVSPELHGRSYMNEWTEYKRIKIKNGLDSIMLCTDYPEEARQFFSCGG